MTWATRGRPKVDRIACPWLINRCVDPEADFLYVPTDQVQAMAAREGATPHDVPGVELGHHGDECSFDAIVRTYDLATSDPALAQLARIVRGADTAQHDLEPESHGLLAIAQGFSLAYADDHVQLAAEQPVYDAVYAWCRQQASTPDWARPGDAGVSAVDRPAGPRFGRLRPWRRAPGERPRLYRRLPTADTRQVGSGRGRRAYDSLRQRRQPLYVFLPGRCGAAVYAEVEEGDGA